MAAPGASRRFLPIRFFDRLEGRHSGGARDVVLVVPVDLGRQEFVGLLSAADRFHGEEGGQAFLPEAELPFDFTFGLGVFGDEVADAEATEGALELGEGIGGPALRDSWPKRLSPSV